MHHRTFRRAIAAAATLVVVTAAVAVADTIQGDSDTVTAGSQSGLNLGDVAPGAVIDVPVAFTLRCGNGQHVDPGQSVRLVQGVTNVAEGGALAFEPVVLGPTPATWAADGTSCSGQQPLTAAGTVRITAPATEGPHMFSVLFGREPFPAGSNDLGAVTGLTGASWSLTVVANTPPVLSLPADATVEGDTAGGATAAYAASVFDAEDSPYPTADCDPAPGDLLALGPNEILCTATDSRGLTDSGTFTITVVDTVAPTLSGVPAGLALWTTDPAGAVLAYDLPSAADVVDPAPTVACSPATGALAAVGDSTVTCSATDDSGNRTSASFPVRVTLGSARWLEPVGTGSPATVLANAGRTIPVKVELFAAGAEQDHGAAALTVRPCAGGADALAVTLSWRGDSGRWVAQLDTSLLPGTGCYKVVAHHDGHRSGEFRLDLRGAETPVKGPAPKR